MIRHFARNLWRWSCGLPEEPLPQHVLPSELKETEWSPTFETLMRNRMIMGAYRYGRLRAKGKRQYDRVGSMIARLERYRVDGNLEVLVDVANLALLEFEESQHPNRHFNAVDDGPHTNPTK